MPPTRIFKTFCLLLLACLSAGNLNAQDVVYTVESVPNPKDGGNGYVSDVGRLLSEDAVYRINGMIASMENTSTAQMAVVIVPSIGDEVPKDFATRLFQHWGIGQEGADNGLLLLVVTDQRRSELETGYGLEGLLPDVICLRILLDELVPRFQKKDYDGGVINTVKRAKNLLENPEAMTEMRASFDPKHSWPRVMGVQIRPVWFWYGVASLLVGLGLITWVLIILFNKEDLFDKYRHIQLGKPLILAIFFPIPCLLIYFALKGVLYRLRNQRRFSKVNGLPMRKLTDSEEDIILGKGRVTEEILGDKDYDVWVTEDGSDVLILSYAISILVWEAYSEYKKCPECKFQTYQKVSSMVLEEATYSAEGSEAIKYECKNCNYQKRFVKKIPKKIYIPPSSDSGSSRSSDWGGSSSSGDSGGSGSWGGGSSGGGGAGASW